MENYSFIILCFMFVLSSIILFAFQFFLNFIHNPFLEKINNQSKIQIIINLVPKLKVWLNVSSILLLISTFSLFLIFYKQIIIYDLNFIINTSIIIIYLLIYYFINSTKIGKNVKFLTFLQLSFICVYILILNKYLSYNYIMCNLFISVLLLIIIIFNLWFKIFPAISNIISSIDLKNNPKTDDVGKYKLYLKHNTYASLILLWTLINFLIGYNLSVLFMILSINILVLLVFIISRSLNE